MSAVIYARVPDSLKAALDAHAGERGLTLTAAVVALLGEGLETKRNGLSLAELEQTRARLREAELRLQAAQEREELSARTSIALAERIRQPLALCPQCREPVSGHDLFVSARCPKPTCGKALSALLLPAPRAGFESNEYLAFLGALGVLVGLAVASAERDG